MQVPRASLSKSHQLAGKDHAPVFHPIVWRFKKHTDKPEKRTHKTRRIVANTLIAAGGTLCLYVAGTYTWMYARQSLLLREWNSRNPAVAHSLTKLSIPKIHLENVVLEGASAHSLLLGPAHLTGSAEPGDLGNAVIAGHRDTFFRHIHSLRYGDSIFVMRGGHEFHYIIRERKIVSPKDLSVLQPTEQGRLTLITCYPTHAIGPAPERLIVIAELASEGK